MLTMVAFLASARCAFQFSSSLSFSLLFSLHFVVETYSSSKIASSSSSSAVITGRVSGE